MNYPLLIWLTGLAIMLTFVYRCERSILLAEVDEFVKSFSKPPKREVQPYQRRTCIVRVFELEQN